jgi:hypothetical protein
MRNILAHLPAKGKAAFADRLKQIWLQPNLESVFFASAFSLFLQTSLATTPPGNLCVAFHQ